MCAQAGDTEENEGDGVVVAKERGREEDGAVGWSVGCTRLSHARAPVPKLAMHLPSLGDSYPSCGKNSPVHLRRDASLRVDGADESPPLAAEIATSSSRSNEIFRLL